MITIKLVCKFFMIVLYSFLIEAMGKGQNWRGGSVDERTWTVALLTLYNTLHSNSLILYVDE